MGMFHVVNAKLGQALEEIPFDDLNISDEVREQVIVYTRIISGAKPDAKVNVEVIWI